jgi:hypothetical protein
MAEASLSAIGGLDAFGANLEPVIAEGLRRFAESLESKHVPRDIITREIMRAASVAASIAEARKRGDIPAEPLQSPILITGFGRTGSTYLHNMLASDEKFRAPNLWELWRPLPPAAPGQRDFRISLAHAQLRLWSREQLQLHPMHPESPEECYWLIPHQHCHALAYNAASYCDWLAGLSHNELACIYGYYADYVRLLMSRYQGQIWLGKCLAHMHFVPVLHEVFPRAKLIRLHRDPRKVIASFCRLLGAFTRGALPDHDPFQARQLVVDVFNDGVRRMMNPNPSIKCADVLYEELVASPFQTVARIYDEFELEAPLDNWRKLSDVVSRPAPPARLTDDPNAIDGVRETDAMKEYIAWAESKWGAGIWSA